MRITDAETERRVRVFRSALAESPADVQSGFNALRSILVVTIMERDPKAPPYQIAKDNADAWLAEMVWSGGMEVEK